MKKALMFTLVIAGVLALSACGPSEEDLASQTEAAKTAIAKSWTATPIPTATATPIPYDLTMQVKDEDGNPVESALIKFANLGEKYSGSDGNWSMEAIPSNQITFDVSAQGYFPNSGEAALERGSNTVDLILMRDPYGILPSEACGPTEKLLYVEDFQDGSAQGWDGIEFRSNGWEISDFTLEEGNIVADNNMPETHPSAGLDEKYGPFDQIVWRFDFYYSESVALTFNFLNSWGFEDEEGNFVEDSRYMILFYSSEPALQGRRVNLPVNNYVVREVFKRISADGWHRFEISRFDGVFSVWVDGERMYDYTDPKPLPGGTIGFEIFEDTDADAMPTFDNIVVCGLSAPFETFPVEAEETGD